MFNLEDTFKNTKPKSRMKYGKFGFVEFPPEYKMPELFENSTKPSVQASQDNSRNNSIFHVPKVVESTKRKEHGTQTIFTSAQKEIETLYISKNNYNDDNYDDFYDDDMAPLNDSIAQSNINNSNLSLTGNDEPRENDLTSDTTTTNNNTLKNNVDEGVVNDDKVINEEEDEEDIYDEAKVFLKSDGKEFTKGHELLPEEKLQEIYRILNEVFGHNSFKHEQKEAIIAGLLGHDIILLMPTGTGKSLCYQLLSIIDPGITIVVSSLKGLIEDEISKLTKLGISTESLVNDLNKEKYDYFYKKIKSKKKFVNLLYVTPEIINGSEKFQRFLIDIHEQGILSRFVVKEAHCITQLSSNFRSDYSELGCLRKNFESSKVPIMALTGGGTPTTVMDIKSLLSIKSSKIFITSFERSNLKYDVIPKTAKSQSALIKKIKRMYPTQSGIFYCFSKKDCETLHASLKDYGITSVIYHSGMSDKAKSEAQQEWMSNKVQVVCGTTAFGVGVHKPDVRFVVHFCMSKSIENYYQESGLAGRDGLPSYCVILYSYLDSVRQKRFIDDPLGNGNPLFKKTIKMKNIEHLKVNQILSYCESISECRRKLLLEHFGEMYDCDKCLKDSKTICNNCELAINSMPIYKLYDLTNEAECILKTSMNITVTMKQMVDTYRGRTCKTSSNNVHLQSTEIFGRGSSLSEPDANRLFIRLITDGYLKERVKIIEGSTFTNMAGYLFLTPKGEKFLSSVRKPKIFLYISIRKKQRNEIKMCELIADEVPSTTVI